MMNKRIRILLYLVLVLLFSAFARAAACPGTITSSTVLSDNATHTGAGNCITIGANNIVLDCQGYSLTGDRTSSSYGVYNNGYDNVTVKNCKIYNFSSGVYFASNANDGAIYDNTAKYNSNYGITVSSCTGNNISFNTLQENDYYDFYFVAMTSSDYCNNDIANNTGSGNRQILFYNSSVMLEDNYNISELVLCNADSSSIDNITVQGSSGLKNNGILVIQTSSTNFTNINSSGNNYGIYIYSSFTSDNNWVNSSVLNNNIRGIYISQTNNNRFSYNTMNYNTYGATASMSDSNNFTYSTMDYNTYGATIGTGADYNRFFLNSLRNNTQGGVYISSGGTTIIVSNNISGSSSGISVSSQTTGSNITSNLLRNNTNGIYLNNARNNNILYNKIQNNSRGIYVTSNSDTNNIVSNTIVQNSIYGIYIYTSLGQTSNNNNIYNNYFNNTNNAYDTTASGTKNYWNTTYACSAGLNIIGGRCKGGNYWAGPNGYDGIDTDGDGIGDTEIPWASKGGITTEGDYLPLTDNPTHSNPYIGAHNRYTEGLVGEWRFEIANSTWAMSETGSNHGTVIGATHTDEGRVGEAFEFDGVGTSGDAGTYISVPDSVSLDITDEITMATWIKVNHVNENLDGIIYKGGSSYAANGPYGMMINSDRKLVIEFQNATTMLCTSFTPAINYNEWYFVAGTFYKNGNSTIYLNGIKQDTDACKNTPMHVTDHATYSTLRIGHQENAAARFFNGTIDEVAIWNRSLSATEISYLYNTSKGTYAFNDQDIGCSPNNVSDPDSDSVKNIVNWYWDNNSLTALNMPFEGGSNTTWTKDYSGFGNNGTVSGAVWNSTGGFDGKGAYQFDGYDDYIDVGEDNSLNFSHELTVTAWFKAKSWNTSNANFIVNDYQFLNTTNQRGWWVGQWFNNFMFRVFFGTKGNMYATTSVPSANAWHHVAGVFDGPNKKVHLYLDGTLVNSSITQDNEINESFLKTYIGKRSEYTPGSNAYDFNGTIDEVLIFDHVLSAEQISYLADKRRNPRLHAMVPEEDTNLAEHWKACITPNDGTQDGDEKCTSEMQIMQNPPESGEYVKCCCNSGNCYLIDENIWGNGCARCHIACNYDEEIPKGVQGCSKTLTCSQLGCTAAGDGQLLLARGPVPEMTLIHLIGTATIILVGGLYKLYKREIRKFRK